MSLRYALLGLLAQRPSSGYDLAKVFRETLNHVWHTNACQIYPELNRLADEGLTTVVEEGPRGRRTYSITPAGRVALHRWLTDPAAEPPPRDAAALRAFLIPLLPTREGVEVVKQHAEHAQGFADYLTEWATETRMARAKDGKSVGDADIFGVLAAELGIRLNAAVVEWADWAVRKLTERTGESVVLGE